MALALVAGAGTGLFTPAALAALPEPRRATSGCRRRPSLYGAIADLGFTAGPAIAAAVLLVFGGPRGLMIANGVTFAISAVVLACLRFGAAPARAERAAAPSLLREAREGLRVGRHAGHPDRARRVRGGALLRRRRSTSPSCRSPTDELDAGDVGYSVLVALFGLGFVAGSLSGSSGGEREAATSGATCSALLVMGAGFLASGRRAGARRGARRLRDRAASATG